MRAQPYQTDGLLQGDGGLNVIIRIAGRNAKAQAHGLQAEAVAIYEELYALYRKVYFAFGDKDAAVSPLAEVLGELREIAARSRQSRLELNA